MEKRLKDYLAATDRLLSSLSNPQTHGTAAAALTDDTAKTGAEQEALLSEHLVQIRFFQHERLIHLIVTCLFAVLAVAVFLSLYFAFDPGLLLLFLALFVLLVPYIRHYYILENGVQRMYAQYDRMRQIFGRYSAFAGQSEPRRHKEAHAGGRNAR